MDGHDSRDNNFGSDGRRRDVIALARSVLSKVAGRDKLSIGTTKDEHVSAFCAALIAPDEAAYSNVLAQIGASGVGPREMMDVYVPFAAEMLGADWADDYLGFAEVSIGSSRLNEIIRSIAITGYDSRGHAVPLGHRALMIVPAEEQHSLGAFIAANQFRKHGLRMHMSIAHSHEEIASLIENERYSMIGISAGSHKLLDPIQRLVELMREWNSDMAPVIIGGAVTRLNIDVGDVTGADLVSSNAREVMQFCGFRSQMQREDGPVLGRPSDAEV